LAKANSNDPNDTAQISQLTHKLNVEDSKMKALFKQTTALSSNAGKQVYQGCYIWAKRGGAIAGTSVRVFKDDATNRAADLAANYGDHFCRCIAVEIAGDDQITDAAKIEIGHQFATKDHIDNQALAALVGVAAGRCQLQQIDELSGGQLSGRH
jgi:hypothetical protein